ncbi:MULTISPECIES: MalY/PatB family protein [Acetobacterium]|uniref:cysteine-S-conjugate beta-lyase n=1 Tax=Acetobacterium wieringae TaxID=52694 RepID=A0A5D0WVN2_9FIRM|nr:MULTISPECIES: MalY/PatB family protein [Acetobacterium]TYC88219.1 pyridoxal phosphate-dependent aminotransferase [Acetobacterium wieringae]
MKYNFDEIITRDNTNSIKYDFAHRRGMPEGLLPLWVADMDFKTPAPVVEALVEKSKHGIFGYSESGQDYFFILKEWFKSRFGWNIQPDWLVTTPGVVYAIATAIRALTREGDSIIIQQPVYYPFAEMITVNERNLVVNQLVYEEGRYRINFDDFEKKILENDVKLFILCNPHNPVGRVWTQAELTRLGDICLKHEVIVIADEIHQDFVYPGFKHLVFANLKPEYLSNTITCTAPSKTFNLAGLQVSNIFIENREIRKKFRKEMHKGGYNEISIMGIVACAAAYSKGQKWLEELKDYLFNNLNFVRTYLAERLPQIKLIEPEGTYLIWLDFCELGLSNQELEDLIINRAGLWLDAGTMFGAGGDGFQRINMASPRLILEQALNQLEKAIKNDL